MMQSFYTNKHYEIQKGYHHNLRCPDAIPESAWSTLVQEADVTTIQAGQFLWLPDEGPLEQTYVLLHGLMRIFHPSQRNQAVTILACGPGGVLGYHPELQDSACGLGAEALADSQLLVFPSELSKEWRGQQDALSHWLLSDLNLRLKDVFLRLRLEHSPARERVAWVLLQLDQLNALAYSSRQQLADLSNLTVETVIRTLSAFLREDILASSYFTRLSSAERQALMTLLNPLAETSLPYL